MPERPKIVVVGSLNVDHTWLVPRIPAPGETITARDTLLSFGGKGANQALAAARAGGNVTLIGCVGEDDFAGRYLVHLRDEGIDTRAIVRTATPTGSAFITVDAAGENAIVVHPGANDALQPEHVEAAAPLIRSAAALLLQLECPLPTVKCAAAIAAEEGIPVLLNPSPLIPEFLESGLSCDTLIVNEHEALALTGLTPAQLQADSSRALAILHGRQLIITCGGDSTWVITGEKTFACAPPKVTPVDTVGAGDAFAGAFVVAQASGASLEKAVSFANVAGALATLKPGAQSSIPTKAEIEQALRSFMECTR